MTEDRAIQVSLLSIRIAVVIVFMAWTIDKVINPTHFNHMLEVYYHVQLSQPVLLIIGVVECLLLLVFFFSNRFKTYTYGFILAAHTLTTLVSAWRLFPPFERHMLLHYATLPMLVVCLMLFLLRHHDTLLKVDNSTKKSAV